MDLVIASLPLLTHVCDIMLLLLVSGDVSVPGCSTARLSPPTKYWSRAGAGVSGHQGSASCLSWPGFDTYFIGLFSDIKVMWVFYIFRSILPHDIYFLASLLHLFFWAGILAEAGPGLGRCCWHKSAHFCRNQSWAHPGHATTGTLIRTRPSLTSSMSSSLQ